MKKTTLSLAIFLLLLSSSISAQFMPKPEEYSPTSIGMVIYSNDVETVWNALRLANHSLKQGDTVQVFLLGKGVEVDLLVNENDDLKNQVDAFLETGGEIQGCGTCLQSRKNDDPQVCTFSSLADLYAVVRKNKIVLTF
ncbi:MAG: DsrE family protein [Bacteroidales bacterium]|nr:DsrE family protein [Bacteroidales bacterium]